MIKIVKVIFLFLALVSLLFLFSGCKDYHSEYIELSDQKFDLEVKYEELKSQYDDVLDSIGSLENDLLTLYAYFEKDPDFSFKEASISFGHIDSALNKIIYPENERK